MNKEKITSQEIIDLIASKASISKRSADDFLKAFLLSVEDALLRGESVKVKQLGTFKLQWIAPRKSVNVRNGEEVVLSGYYKVHFTPEGSLKALVNEPFAHLEAVELDGDERVAAVVSESVEVTIDPLRMFTEQASEISNILSEIQSLSSPAQMTPKVPVSTSAVHEDAFDVETSELKQPIVVAEPRFVAPVFEDVSKTSDSEGDTKFNLFMKEVKPLRKRKTGIFLFVLLIVFGGFAFWIYQSPSPAFLNTLCEKSESFFRTPVAKKIVRKKLVIVHRRYFQQAPVGVEKDSLQLLFDQARVYKEFIGSERIAAGSRLARMSMRYYGCSDFWVYIYEANKGKIPNPDNIPFGTLIRIPKLDVRLIDAKNPRCIQKARELHDLYVP